MTEFTAHMARQSCGHAVAKVIEIKARGVTV
jgi:hypothetical protein